MMEGSESTRRALRLAPVLSNGSSPPWERYFRYDRMGNLKPQRFLPDWPHYPGNWASALQWARAAEEQNRKNAVEPPNKDAYMPGGIYLKDTRNQDAVFTDPVTAPAAEDPFEWKDEKSTPMGSYMEGFWHHHVDLGTMGYPRARGPTGAELHPKYHVVPDLHWSGERVFAGPMRRL